MPYLKKKFKRNILTKQILFTIIYIQTIVVLGRPRVKDLFRPFTLRISHISGMVSTKTAKSHPILIGSS